MNFPDQFYCVVLVLYAPTKKRVVVKRSTMAKALDALDQHPRRGEFNGNDARMQVDFVLEEPKPVDQPLKIEVGIDGLMIEGEDKTHIFLPADCFVRSIMGMGQLYEYLNRAYGDVSNLKMKTFRSQSFISFGNDWIPLYRGYPLVGNITKQSLEYAVELAMDHVKLTQQESGKFLYYYDPVSNSTFEPFRNRTEWNQYYNILRHAGGGLLCLDYESYTNGGSTKQNIIKCIEYLIKSMVVELVDGVERAYVFSERKGKLGGSGIGLYLLAHYEMFYQDSTYRVWAERLYRHLLAQITESGEFIYYNIYLDKKITEETNQQYFSFYYPGEALCGMAAYLKLLPQDERQAGFEKSRKALEFLLHIRPTTHASHYADLPSDSWLMMAISEMWEFPEMRQDDYMQFVFDDADKMIAHMYTHEDAPYPDYVGSFYYQFGDHPYPDGSRCEGLVAAYELARKAGNEEVANRVWGAMLSGAWSCMHLVNTPESTYSVPNPALTIGGIRLKLTRQWFRIDTIQHVAGFYAKMLPYWDQETKEIK